MSDLLFTVDPRFGAEIERRLKKMKDTKALMKQVGLQGVSGVAKNFDQQKSEDNRPWKPLSMATLLARRSKNRKGKKSTFSEKILQDTGHMRNIQFNVLSNHSVKIGTSVDYGEKHQYGLDVPKREWLYFNQFTKDRINETAKRFYEKALNG